MGSPISATCKTHSQRVFSCVSVRCLLFSCPFDAGPWIPSIWDWTVLWPTPKWCTAWDIFLKVSSLRPFIASWIFSSHYVAFLLLSAWIWAGLLGFLGHMQDVDLQVPGCWGMSRDEFEISHVTVTRKSPSMLDLFMQLNCLRLLPPNFPLTLLSRYDITSEKRNWMKVPRLEGSGGWGGLIRAPTHFFWFLVTINFDWSSLLFMILYLEYVLYLGVFFGGETYRKVLIKTVLWNTKKVSVWKRGHSIVYYFQKSCTCIPPMLQGTWDQTEYLHTFWCTKQSQYG